MVELTPEIRRRLRSARVARLATIAPDGRPHLVPVVFAIDDGELCTAVDHKPKTTRDLARLRNIAQTPEVCLLVDHYNDDWSDLWWVRVDGTATVHEPGSAPHTSGGRALLEAYPDHYTSVELGRMIRIAPTKVRSWGLTPR